MGGARRQMIAGSAYQARMYHTFATTCSTLRIEVTGTGAHGNVIKEDLIAAIWIYAMDFSSMEYNFYNIVLLLTIARALELLPCAFTSFLCHGLGSYNTC